MKIVIAAGGTGGHFYPGLAVAKEWKAAGHDVSFIIRKADYVLSLLEREGILYAAISAAGFRRSIHPINLINALKLGIGFFESFIHLIRRRPQLIVVMGGYLSVPPTLAARILGVPILLHEQNVIPGMANRLLASLASKVAVSFAESLAAFGGKAVVTGNPVRPEFITLPAREHALNSFHLKPEKTTVLIFGGSLGARAINRLIVKTLKISFVLDARLQFLHFTGPKEEAEIKAEYSEMMFGHHVSGYCHDMVSAYAAADFVICRAGASTVSELIAVEKPALLIPYPYATGGHQTANARVLSEVGAALLIEEKDLTKEKLKQVFDEIILRPEKLKELASSYKLFGFSPLDAAKKIRVAGEELVGPV